MYMVHGLWMSACLVCRCCVFMFWERRARLHDFGLGQRSMLTVSPESSYVTHQVQQFQGQWMAINPKDALIINIYIYMRERGFRYILDYTTLYPLWCPFIYLISPLLGALYPYQMDGQVSVAGLAPRWFSLTRSKSESYLVSPSRSRSVIKTMVNGWKGDE